ncbi:hypothetical protein [Streptomyces sp. NPDC060184]
MFRPEMVRESSRYPADASTCHHGLSECLTPRLTQCRVVDFGKVWSTSCR